ncbi:MAG: type II toxin-antitoxin system VapC family toxin [Ignavibacteria bacterium]|nr:type II toxin-antitoxin system VapC family toxin [Ignavibacteria bacterium]
MNFLLDTHTLLWSIANTRAIPESTLEIISNPINNVFVSSVSLWEIAIKQSIGKLVISNIHSKDLVMAVTSQGFTFITLEPEEALESRSLKRYNNHNDPFDRMLIFQALKRNYTLISKDSRMIQYEEIGLKLLW